MLNDSLMRHDLGSHMSDFVHVHEKKAALDAIVRPPFCLGDPADHAP